MAETEKSGSTEKKEGSDEERVRKGVKESLKEYFPTFSAAPGKVNAALKTDVSPYMKSFYERLLKKEEFGGEKKKSILLSLLTLAFFVVIFYLDFSGRFSWSFYIRFLVYLVLSAIVFLVLLAASKMDDRKKALYVLILFLYSLLLPTFFGFIQNYFGLIGLTSIAIILLLPLGPVVFLEKVDFMHPTVKSLIVFFYAAIMIVLLLPYIGNITNLTAVDHLFNTLSQYAPQVSGKEGWESYKDALNKMIENAKKSYTSRLEYATGGYYNGVVEENEKEPLGVYLENVKTTEKEFFTNEPVGVWGTLKAKNLDPENPVIINLYCEGKKGKDTIYGIINPDEFPDEGVEISAETENFERVYERYDKDLQVFFLDEKDIQCDFKEGELDKGSTQISVNAVFNFQTMAYLKTYFMNLETLRTLNQENIDPFKQYGITERTPQAIFTNGPVKIGMELRNPPIGISADFDTKVRLGITIENRWEGQIERLNKLFVYLPEGIEFDESCDKFEEPTSGVEDLGLRDEGDRPTYKAYQLTKKELNNFREIKEFSSVVCFLKIPPDSLDTILAETPFATRYVRATAQYDYNLRKDVNVQIQAPKGFYLQFSPTKPTSADRITCQVSNSDFPIKINSFQFAVNDQPPILPAPACEGDKKKCSISIEKQPKDSKVVCIVDAERDRGIGEEAIEGVLDISTEAIDKYQDSVSVVVANSKPAITGIKFETAEEGKEATCKIKVEDKDNDNVVVVYWFEGDYGTRNAEIPCPDECIVSVPSTESVAGRSIICNAIPYDTESAYGKKASVRTTIKAAPLPKETT